ncbi:MAG: UDP-N-acetylglucosamine 2-epimerase [Gemmatimonadales bacterium]
MSRRRVLGVTGIRSEYDILSSVFEAIRAHPALALEVVVTGTHLSPAYGETVREIRKDGFRVVEEIESLISGDRDASRVTGLAVQLQGLAQAVARLRPDLLLMLGDREEAMSTALVGNYLNIPVAHIAGGDRVVGNADDQVRHAVTKLAHLHFATNAESARRIRRLGEQRFRVFDVGNPGLDRLRTTPKLSAAALSRRLGFALAEREPFILLIQHPLSSEIEEAGTQMRVTLDAVETLGIKTVLTYPNSDAGSQAMIRAIESRRGLGHLHAVKSLPRLEFVNLMRRAACLLGNSSAGLLEAPLLKLPVVNVGNRQKGRLHAGNVQFVPHDARAIVRAARRAVFDPSYRARVGKARNPYGDGRSSPRIARVLATIPIDDKLRIKDMTY